MRDESRNRSGVWPLWALVVALFAAAGGYYSGFLSASAATRLVTPDEITNATVYTQAIGAVVTVEAKIPAELLPQGQKDDRTTGSGFFYKSNLVVTNYHVIEQSVENKVTLKDGRTFPTQTLAVDEGLDIAILRVSGYQVSRPLGLGSSSNLTPGQKLIILGTPQGKPNSITVGVLSSVNRVDDQGQNPEDTIGTEIPEMLLTDANIDAGNSGGPALDSQGRVVGVVDAALVSNVGLGGLIGLVIPVNLVKDSLSDLERYGVSQRGNLGVGLVSLSELDPLTRRGVGLTSANGAFVDDTPPGSPGQRAGLRGATRDRSGKLETLGDVILKVNNRVVRDRYDVIQEVARLRPGETATLSVWRNRAPATVRVPIAVRKP